MIIQKSKPPAHTKTKELECERQHLYLLACKYNLTSKPVIEQSNLVDKHILEDVKRQLLIKY